MNIPLRVPGRDHSGAQTGCGELFLACVHPDRISRKTCSNNLLTFVILALTYKISNPKLATRTLPGAVRTSQISLPGPVPPATTSSMALRKSPKTRRGKYHILFNKVREFYSWISAVLTIYFIWETFHIQYALVLSADKMINLHPGFCLCGSLIMAEMGVKLHGRRHQCCVRLTDGPAWNIWCIASINWFPEPSSYLRHHIYRWRAFLSIWHYGPYLILMLI